MSGFAKATPRPWVVNKNDNTMVSSHEKNTLVADVYDGLPFTLSDDEIAIANTALIVRAVSCYDEMLAVLKELEASAGYWSEYDVPLGIVDRLKAAIAKAEGRK